MKNLFGINITNSKENNLFDGVAFITKRLSLELRSKLDYKYLYFEKKRQLPLPLTVIQIIAMLFLVIALRAELERLFDNNFDIVNTFSVGYHNAPYLYYADIICLVIFIVIKIIEIYRKRKAIKGYEEYSKAKEAEAPEEDYEKNLEEAAIELGIPDEPEHIDVLMFKYKNKKDKDKLVSFGLYNYKNINYMAYVKDGNLCFSDLYFVMSIPLSSMDNIIKAKKRATFPWWNKEAAYNSKEYKKYKISLNGQGTYFAYFYKIQIRDIKGDFEFFIPNYDIERFINLTHLRIEEE